MSRIEPVLIILAVVFPLVVAAEPEELRDRLQKEVQEAHQLAEQGKLDEAIRMLEQLVREVPSESLAVKLHYDLANLLFVQGRYREARAVYTRVIQLAEDQQEMTRRSRERIAKMKERESQKKDEVALQLIDIETAVDLGQFPPSGSKEFLRTVEKETASLHRERAGRLLEQLLALEDTRVRALLNEARRLYDEEKNYPGVVPLLETIVRDYPDCEEMPSVRILLEETQKRLRRRSAQVPSLQEAR